MRGRRSWRGRGPPEHGRAVVRPCSISNEGAVPLLWRCPLPRRRCWWPRLQAGSDGPGRCCLVRSPLHRRWRCYCQRRRLCWLRPRGHPWLWLRQHARRLWLLLQQPALRLLPSLRLWPRLWPRLRRLRLLVPLLLCCRGCRTKCCHFRVLMLLPPWGLLRWLLCVALPDVRHAWDEGAGRGAARQAAPRIVRPRGASGRRRPLRRWHPGAARGW